MVWNPGWQLKLSLPQQCNLQYYVLKNFHLFYYKRRSSLNLKYKFSWTTIFRYILWEMSKWKLLLLIYYSEALKHFTQVCVGNLVWLSCIPVTWYTFFKIPPRPPPQISIIIGSCLKPLSVWTNTYLSRIIHDKPKATFKTRSSSSNLFFRSDMAKHTIALLRGSQIWDRRQQQLDRKSRWRTNS